MDYLSKLKALEAAATKGPWEIPPEDLNGRIFQIGPISGYDFDALELRHGDPDALFVQESRTAIPWLVGMIEEARGLMGHDLDIAQRAQLVWAWDAKLRQGPPERGK